MKRTLPRLLIAPAVLVPCPSRPDAIPTTYIASGTLFVAAGIDLSGLTGASIEIHVTVDSAASPTWLGAAPPLERQF